MSQQQPPAHGTNSFQTQYSTAGYQHGASTLDPQYSQPPAKRQRLSPDPQSPEPGQSNGAYRPPQATTSGGYGNPYAQPHQAQQQYSAMYSPQYQQSPQNSFNSPDAYPGNRQAWQAQPQMYGAQQRPQNAGSPSSSQMMPPPPKPVREEKDEKVGVDDINDALFASGIDLKAEENYMHNLYNNRHSAQDSFLSQQGSFGSSTQGGSFSLQGSFSTQPNSAHVGTIGAVLTEDDIEQELKHKRTAAAREKAEHDQHQLENPFISGNVMRLRMETISKEQGVRLNTDGLYIKVKAQTKVVTNGTDGIVVAKPESVVDRQAPLADILSLLSLASGERVRGLLDESYGLARARRYADHGRVPIEFKDVAVGSGAGQAENVVPESITGTSWDQVDVAAKKAQTTVSFQSAVNSELRMLARRDQDAEKARNAKREARRKAQEAAIANGEDVAMDTALDSTPTTASNDAAQPAKMTKKELARQQKEKATFTEAQAATSTNQTAAMMAMGKKSSRYSWMTGGASSMPTNRFAKTTPAPSTPGSGSGTASRKDAHNAGVKRETEAENTIGMSWGEWRESNSGGRGIQVRDWLLVLERDGKEKKAWERTLLHMDAHVESTISK